MVTKRFFLMLALLIHGIESVTSENVDVYLAPLIEELQQLWEGVDAVDIRGGMDSKGCCLVKCPKNPF